MDEQKLILFWDESFNKISKGTLKILAYLSLPIIPLPLVIFIIYLIVTGASPEELGIIILVGGFLVLIGFITYWLFWRIVRVISRRQEGPNGKRE